MECERLDGDGEGGILLRSFWGLTFGEFLWSVGLLRMSFNNEGEYGTDLRRSQFFSSFLSKDKEYEYLGSMTDIPTL